MDLYQIFILTLYITQAFTKSRKSRKHKMRASDEGSIENLLYIKDCQHNGKTEKPEPLRMEVLSTPPPPTQAPRQNDCPFPKMCCSMTCGNDCGSAPTSHFMKPSEPFSSIQRSNVNMDPAEMPVEVVQPQMKRMRKKKKLPPNDLQAPLPNRRDFSGLTKERIKGVLAKDEDIRKILKDLVRVTMQKVDLQDMMKSKPEWKVYTERSEPSDVVDDYVE